MIDRTLEPEVMDTEVEARDYDAMDHAEVNERFAVDFLALRGDALCVLDVGTGTARIPILIAQRVPGLTCVAIDLAEHMMVVARANVRAAGLEARVKVETGDAKGSGYADASFDAVVSNSIIHHIPTPEGALREMWRVLHPGGLLFVRDLVRPSDTSSVDALVATYAPLPLEAADEDLARHRRQRDLFEASLRAALSVEEVRAMVVSLGVAPDAVTVTSDRHWTLATRKRA